MTNYPESVVGAEIVYEIITLTFLSDKSLGQAMNCGAVHFAIVIRGLDSGRTSPISTAETPASFSACVRDSPSGVQMKRPPAVWGS